MSEGASFARSIPAVAGRLCLSLGVLGALAAPAAASTAAPAYSNGHPYRHGAVPVRGKQHTVAFNTPKRRARRNNLSFGGGVSGVGVTTGPEKVYLVFWGSQWGTQSTNSSGYTTFSGDPEGVAPDAPSVLHGPRDRRRDVVGRDDAVLRGHLGRRAVVPDRQHLACRLPDGRCARRRLGRHLSGGARDGHRPPARPRRRRMRPRTSATRPRPPNRDAQYVIISPTGTDPDSYETQGFCAWHDYTGDSTMDGGGAVSGSLLAFTNLPYIPDAGASCGQGFVNSPGTLDGVTIVEGHEYAETITDQFPAGGWIDSTGEENGDKCAWISSGQGASQNVTLTTGSFAVQSTWANDFNGGAGGCEVSHPIVTNSRALTASGSPPRPPLLARHRSARSARSERAQRAAADHAAHPVGANRT